MSNIETGTNASRILFIDSRDGQNISGDEQLTTYYRVLLQDPIVVPNHHSLLLSLHRLNIPRSFYNFDRIRNAGLEVIFVSKDGTNGVVGGFGAFQANRPAYLSFEFDEGNYDAISLMNLITTRVNDYLLTGEAPDYQISTAQIDLDNDQKGIYELEMTYNRDALKYEWGVNIVAGSISLGVMYQ